MKFYTKIKNRISKYNKNKGSRFINSKGFTLVETLIAVFVLTIALAALLNLVSTSLSAFKYSRDEVTANYLIQEVVDSVRNKRDTDVFLGDSNGWTTYLSNYGKDSDSLCFSPGGCVINPQNGEASVCSSGGNESTACPLYLDESHKNSGFYSSDSSKGVESTFKRKVNMYLDTARNNGNELDVKVTVEWQAGRNIRSRVLNFSLLNWR